LKVRLSFGFSSIKLMPMSAEGAQSGLLGYCWILEVILSKRIGNRELDGVHHWLLGLRSLISVRLGSRHAPKQKS